MSDLSEDDLELATTVSTRLQAANRRAYIDRDTLNLADRLQRAALELQRHRTAHAADSERVRSVVLAALDELTEGWSYIDRAHAGPAKDAIATRAAEQLATAGVGIGDEERDALLWAKQQAERYVESSWYEKRSATIVTQAKRAAAVLDRLLGVSK